MRLVASVRSRSTRSLSIAEATVIRWSIAIGLGLFVAWLAYAVRSRLDSARVCSCWPPCDSLLCC
jgi:hypothetical protein